MAVDNEPNKIIHNTNGVTTSFPFSFKYFTDENILVKTITPTGVETTKVLNTDYTISSSDPNAGGNVIFVTAPATGTMLIKRVLDLSSDASFRPVSGFPEEVITDAFDASVMRDQDLQEQISRGLSLPEGSSVSDLTLPNPSAGKALIWKNDETGIENSELDVNDMATYVTQAAASASTAATQATNASTSATAAAASASTAATQATNASTSATAAAASAASINLPTAVALNYLRQKSDVSGFENRTPAQVADDIGAFRKNFLINGCMRLAQRLPLGNTRSVGNAAGTYLLDRWMCCPMGANTTATNTIEQVSNTLGFDKAIKFGSMTLAGTVPANIYLLLQQRIEAVMALNLANKNVSVAFDIYHDLGSAMNVNIDMYTPTNTADDFSVNTHIITTPAAVAVPTGVKTRVKFENISVGDCSKGLYLQISPATGAITNKNVYISNVQLEIGSKCTEFEHRPFGLEVTLCQRYFRKSYALSDAPGAITGNNQAAGIASDTGNFYGMGYSALGTTMRTAPTCTPYSTVTGTSGKVRDYSSSADVTAKTDGAVNDVRTNSSGTLTAGHLYFWHWTADAEL